MKRRNIYLSICSIATLLTVACSEDSVIQTGPVDGLKTEIRLQAEIDQANVSRADDNGFAGGDRVGVYAVNFESNGNPGALNTTGNLADNIGFTFNGVDGKWVGDRSLYFTDDKTPVDFYGYYPFMNDISDISNIQFSVEKNQSTEAANGKLSGYEASDFLWGKTLGVTPSTPLVSMVFKHILASVQVTLLEGNGFEPGEWAKLDKNVIISNTNRNATINLATGETKLVGQVDDSGIITNPYKNDFRAIVIPQSIEAGKSLITITVDGKSYELKKDVSMNYLSSKMHKFTIEVLKSMSGGDYEFSLIEESITAWESDPTSHDGKAKEYVVVTVPEAGTLGEAVSMANLDAGVIKNLKIEGFLNSQDFEYLRKNVEYLEAINLKNVTLSKGNVKDGEGEENQVEYTLPFMAFAGMKLLQSVVFPEKLKRIGDMAFLGTHISGSLDLPEGLEYIGSEAFHNSLWPGYGSSVFPGGPQVYNNLTGTLTLPSTLKYIGYEAFADCDFTGSLILPEGLEYIGERAFYGCENMTGELHLPHTLKDIGTQAFAKMKGLQGNLVFPRHLTKINAIGGGTGFVSITFPDAPTTIADEAFWESKFRGDIKIPETVTRIGRAAFAASEISHIIFPQKLEFIDDNLCSWNKNLQDTIIIPPLIETIGERAFAECEKLDAVILPKGLLRIKKEAFQNCYSLSYIHSQAVEPPALEESAFYGVNKDNFTVEVPEESVDAYRNASGWREFKRIAAYRNFVARPSKYNVLNKGGKKEIILNADAEWEMIECPSWCHIDKTSGFKKTAINLTVDQMAHGQANRFGEITFRLKGAQDYLTHINVGQYDYEYDEDQYLALQSATKGQGVNLAFIGDGYDAADIAAGTYLEDMKQEIEYFFAVEPYSTYKEYFNVYTAFPLSEDSGVETLNRWRNTKFHTCTGDGNTRLTADYQGALDYCAKVITPTVGGANPNLGCILLGNTNIYEGITYSMTNSDIFCAVVTKSDQDYPYDARGLIQHEAGGHGIGWLADEYRYHIAFINKCTCICCGHVDELKANHATGFGLNLSLTGRYKEVPWTHLIFNPDYGDIVDIYEGGYFHSRGVYRSEHNSCMNNNVPYFSTWSRQLIVQRIMKMAGEPFDLNSFYAKDSRAVGRDFTSTSRTGATNVTTPARHGNAPIRITNYKYGKKGAKR